MATDRVERKHTAVLFADLKGYSRLTGEDEVATHETLTAYRETMHFVQQHHGRIVDSAGDGLLADFASAVDAVQCAVEIQRNFKQRNAELADDRRMDFRIGINIGDVIVEGANIHGDGVDVAARLESLADPGGICISGAVHGQLGNKLALAFDFMGDQQVRNITEPVPTYRIRLDGDVPAAAIKRTERRFSLGNAILSASAVIIVVAGAVVVWDGVFRGSEVVGSVTATAPPEVAAAVNLSPAASIAVLPFVDLSRNSQNDEFADGLTEDVITSLSNLRNLKVIARNSVFAYKGRSVKAQQVARELGVRYVLEGSIQRRGDTVRITSQLIDGATGYHLWADRYDRELKDLFSVQDEIAEKVTQVLAGYSVERDPDGAENGLIEGIGVVIGLNVKKSRVVIDHEEIKDFMAPMEMSYMVSSSKLLKNLKPGDKVRFKIDMNKRMVVEILPMKQ